MSAAGRRVARPALLCTLAITACAHRIPVSTPRVAPDLVTALLPAQHVLDSAIGAGAAPGAVLAVSFRGREAFLTSGHLGVHDPATPTAETLYDLASLTKVVGLTTLAMMAVEEGRLDLDAPVVRYLPEFGRGGGAKAAVTVRDLLLHDSGLPAGRPLWRETFVRSGAILRTITTDLRDPPGARMVYSDLGAITLTAIVEQLYGKRIDRLVRERIARPLGLALLRYLPPRSWRARIAPTENDPWRGREIRGEVHDENAAWMDGVSGHAGLFASAADLLRFGAWALAGAKGDAAPGLPAAPAAFATWTRRQNRPEGSSRALGWDTPSGSASSAGRYLSARAFGHTGFTGTSLWVDPANDLVVVLLTNRVNPTRTTPAFGNIRGAVTDAVALALLPGIPPR